MNWENLITTIVGIIGTLGGWEGIKYLINRKNNKRINDAEADSTEAKADSDEFHVLREMVQFLQTELKEKEERFAEQTTLVRNLNADIVSITNEKNTEILNLTEENSTLKLELQKYKCVVPKCPKRQPQNGY